MRCYALIHKHLFIIQNNGIQEESYNNQICKIVTTVERVMLNGTFDYTYMSVKSTIQDVQTANPL